jgi:hypothetical protein
MKAMIIVWKRPCESGILEVFIVMGEFAEEIEGIKPHVPPHFTNLERYFKNCFLELTLKQYECT